MTSSMPDKSAAPGDGTAFSSDIDRLTDHVERCEAERSALFDAIPDYAALLNLEGACIRANERLEATRSMAADVSPDHALDAVAPGLSAAVATHARAIAANGLPLTDMLIETGSVSTLRRFRMEGWPVRQGQTVVGVMIRARDVAREEADAAILRHIMRELQHRVKNTLANVLALVEQATRSEDDKDRTLRSLRDRITALAMTHGLLTETNWHSAALRTLVTQEIGALLYRDQVTIMGDDVLIGAQPALALAMALHELAANSIRYGALSESAKVSEPAGRVDVSWTLDDEKLLLTWSEQGSVQSDPASSPGFGWRLVKASITNSLRGTLDFKIADGTMTLVICLPRNHVVVDTTPYLG